MYCFHCGSELEGNPKFCYVCGKSLEQEGKTEQSEQPIPAQVFKPKRKKTLPRWAMGCGLATIVLILVFALVMGGIYLWLGLQRTNQTARIVPDDTGVLLTIRPSLMQLIHLGNAGNLVEGGAVFAALPGVWEMVDSASSTLPLDLKIDPKEDILPWLGGEVGMAILYEEERAGLPGPAAPPQSRAYYGPPIILTAATRNQNKSDEFLADLRNQLEDEEIDFDRDTYNGVDVYAIVSSRVIPLAYASFDHMVVIATDVETLKDAIDASQGKGGRVLYDQDEYKKTLRGLPDNRLGAIYVNWKSMIEYLDVSDLDEVPITGLKAIENIGISFSLVKDGLRFDYATQYDLHDLSPAQQALLRESFSSKTLTGSAPADTILFVSGQSLSSSYQALYKASDTGDIEDFVEDLEDELGVRIDNDLLEVLSGDYAILLSSDPDSLLSDFELPFGAIILVQVEDKEKANDSMDDLFDQIANDSDMDFYHDTVDGVDVWMLEDRVEDYTIGYGFLDKVLFVGSSGNMIEAAISAQDSSMAKTDLYKETVGQLPGKSRGIIYLNFKEALDSVAQAMDEYKEEIEPYIESIQAVGLANEPMDKDGLLHGVLFIHTEND